MIENTLIYNMITASALLLFDEQQNSIVKCPTLRELDSDKQLKNVKHAKRLEIKVTPWRGDIIYPQKRARTIFI